MTSSERMLQLMLQTVFEDTVLGESLFLFSYSNKSHAALSWGPDYIIDSWQLEKERLRIAKMRWTRIWYCSM